MKNIILAICYGFGVGLNSLIGISCTTSSSVEIENNIDPHIITPVYVALQQRNLEQLKARLTNFSDPTSEHYGQWLDRETISQTISPTLDRQAEVLSWINQYQVVNVENYGDAIKFYANPLTIRDMFNIGQKEKKERKIIQKWKYKDFLLESKNHIGIVNQLFLEQSFNLSLKLFIKFWFIFEPKILG